MKSSDGELDASDVNDMEKAHSLLSEVCTRRCRPRRSLAAPASRRSGPPPAAVRCPPKRTLDRLRTRAPSQRVS